MAIEELAIRNFKSIRKLDLNCKKINLFIGEPNTGKSNILEALGVLSHTYHGNLTQFVRFEVLTDLFYDHVQDKPIDILFDASFLGIEFADGRFKGTYSRTGQEQRVNFEYDYYGNPGLFRANIDCQRYKFYRFSKRLSFPNPRSDYLRPPDGDNLLAVVLNDRRLRGVVKDIFGKFGYRIVFRPQEGKMEVQKELEDVLVSFPYSLASETLQRLVFYLAAIDSNKESVLSFEEPEAHAFPYYTKYLAERIALDENKNQFFIATHNPYFLMSILEKTPKEDIAVFVTFLENYETKAETLTETQMQEILDMGYDVFFNIERFLTRRKE